MRAISRYLVVLLFGLSIFLVLMSGFTAIQIATLSNNPPSSDNMSLGTSAEPFSNATVISDDGDYWNTGMSAYPDMAIDSTGNVHVVWFDGTPGAWGADMEIMYANYSAALGWSNATVISDDADSWNTGSSSIPNIAIDNSDNLHVVWSDDTVGPWGGGLDSEIMYVNYTASAGWSNATVISDDQDLWNTGTSNFAEITTDNAGNIHVVWGDDTSGPWGGGMMDPEVWYTNYTGAGGWSNATLISDDNTDWNTGSSNLPLIAVDSLGSLHVVWTDSTDGPWGSFESEIMYSNFSAGIGWGNATVISDDGDLWNTGMSQAHEIIANGTELYVVWSDETPGIWKQDPIFDAEIMFANYTVGAGWSNATVISDGYLGVYWNNNYSAGPRMAMDSKGNLHVAWTDGTEGPWGGEWTIDDEIMYVNYTTTLGWSNVTIVSDGFQGDYWNDNMSLWSPIAIDKWDNIHVVWFDYTEGPWSGGMMDIEIMHCFMDMTAPWDNNPPDQPAVEANSTGNTIDWRLYDYSVPGDYQVERNGTQISGPYQPWTNGTLIPIPINTDIGLDVWEYVISYNDSQGNTNSDVVYVTIVDTTDPWDNNPPDQPAVEPNSTSNTIDWQLWDLVSGGNYLVQRNGTDVITSTPWTNGTLVQAPIDTNIGLGLWHYWISYSDGTGNANIDDVYVTVVDTTIPWDNDPADMPNVEANSTGYRIDWQLYDMVSPGNYRVERNSTEIVPSTGWTNGTIIQVTVNADIGLGLWEYIIYYDDGLGNPTSDTVQVTVVDTTMPGASVSPVTTAVQFSTRNIDCTFTDSVGAGDYRVWRNDTVVISWTPWINGSSTLIPLNTSVVGVWNYTIEFNDSQGNPGTTIENILTITAYVPPQPPVPPIPGFELIFLLLGLLAVVTYVIRRKKLQKQA